MIIPISPPILAVLGGAGVIKGSPNDNEDPRNLGGTGGFLMENGIIWKKVGKKVVSEVFESVKRGIYKVQFGSWGLIGGSVPTPEWTFYRSVLRKMILSFLVCGSFMFGFTLFRFFQLRGEEKDFDKEKTDHGGTDGE